MKIHILSPEVIDQIAAGEVVERPAHLVKELVENALDAGATEIEVEFDQGGRWVRIKDNGAGIEKEDLPLALARHGTSKISKTSDIWSLKSYGFRGEALASIAAVSRLTLISKPKQRAAAYRLASQFGEMQEVTEVGAEDGTTIIVEDLFANVPARLKFLKSDAAESTQIKNVLKAMALAYPSVDLRVRSKGKLLYFWSRAESRLERVRAILEKPEMFVGTAEHGGFSAEVVLCAPNETTGNSKQIWIFVQNRWVQDRSLQAAVMDAYRSLLMHGEFPYSVVWLACDPEEVDVNIHPTKSQVKFRKASEAFRAVTRSVRATLERAPWVASMIHSSSKRVEASTASENLNFGDTEFQRTQYSKKSFPLQEGSVMESLQDYSPSPTYSSPSVSSSSDENLISRQFREESELDAYLHSEDLVKTLSVEPSESSSDVKSPSPLSSTESCQPSWSRLQILGQAHLTYIVAQSSKSMLLIDQHAAHERVAYESLMAAWRGGKVEVQNYLVPLTLDMEAEQVEALMSVNEDLTKLGVHIEQLGPEALGIIAAPPLIKESALKKAMDKLADEMVEKGGSFALEKTVSDICATLACHSVVRAGQSLSEEQMRSLLEQMDEYSMSSFCPHGRPVYVEYPFSKVERDFGRIV